MSVTMMGRIWPQVIEPFGRKFVLLAFADAANDDGVTWIALESERGKLDLRTKCSMSLRALQGHIQALEGDGYLERYETAGKGCLWRVHPTPAKSAGVQASTPAEFAPPPAEFAGEPSSNRQGKENTGEPLSISGKCPLTTRALPAGVTLDQWEAFLDMRASIAKPVKRYVASIILANLDKIGKAGWHAGDVLDRSTVHAWPDVYAPEEGRVTGVRRVVANRIAEPVGMSEEDMAEIRRIAAIEDFAVQRRERAAFQARVEARNAPSPLGEIAGQLPLRPRSRTDREIAAVHGKALL
jgi:hypothetical protein